MILQLYNTNLSHTQYNKHRPLQSAIDERAFADEAHIAPDNHPWLVFLDKPMLIDKPIKNTTDSFPLLEPDDPHRNLSDMEILKSKITSI